MSDRSGRAADAVSRLELRPGAVIGELGDDEDVDDEFRSAVETVVGSELLDGTTDELFDALLLWWRAEDGDLTDELVDAVSALADNGVIYLLVPRAGRDGYVDASEIEDAAETAGLPRPTTGPVLSSWSIVKLGRTRGKVRR